MVSTYNVNFNVSYIMPTKDLKNNIQDVHDFCININSRTVYVNSEYNDSNGHESGVDYLMFSRFLKNIDLLNSISSNKITVKTSNIGGDFDYGMAMYDIIKNSRSKVDYIIYSLGASMGAIIPQAAYKRYINKNAAFMVHNGEYSISNTMRAANAQISFYNSRNPNVYDIFAERCVTSEFFQKKKYTVADTKKFITDKLVKVEDWWMTSDEALYYGFVDEII